MSQRQTNLKKIEMDCNCAFWKLIVPTVQSSFLFVSFEITLGSGRHDLFCLTWFMSNKKCLLDDRHHGFELSRSADCHSYFVGVSFTIVYTCQDHVLESLKIAFFIVILDSKYSKMKQKSHWLHSSIKFANPAWNCDFVFQKWLQCAHGLKFHSE